MKTKMKIIASIKIWVVIYPSITLVLYLLGKSDIGLPLYIKTLLLTLILVPWIVFAGVPLVDHLIKLVRLAKVNKKLKDKSNGLSYKEKLH